MLVHWNCKSSLLMLGFTKDTFLKQLYVVTGSLSNSPRALTAILKVANHTEINGKNSLKTDEKGT